jgi:hypothetical protein
MGGIASTATARLRSEPNQHRRSGVPNLGNCIVPGVSQSAGSSLLLRSAFANL